MKNKKLSITFIIIGLLLIIIGSILIIIDKIDKSEKIKLENKNAININYDIFKEKIDVFTKERSNVKNNVLSDMFVETVANYDDWVVALESYKKSIDDSIDNSSTLKDLCLNKKYSDTEGKTKCDSFIIAYETAVNYYTKDIVEFNKNIDEFNNSLDNKLENFESGYEFIDLDDDGKYIGKD